MSLDPEDVVAPAQGLDSLTTTGSSSEGSADSTSRSSVLVLEDNEALRQMLSWDLSDLGYAVCAVGSCREARALAAVQVFDLALLDIGLPDGDGAELASELLERCPAIGIVLCSGRPVTPAARRLQPGILARFSKPVPVHLLDVLFRERNRPHRRR